MKRRLQIRYYITVGLLFLLFLLVIPSTTEAIRFEKDEYFFHDVDVLLVGRCRSIFYTHEFTLPYYVGKVDYFGLEASITPLERVHLWVHNQTAQQFFFHLKLAGIDMFNANGTFFWASTKPYGASLMPPIVFIKCHAENLSMVHFHLRWLP